MVHVTAVRQQSDDSRSNLALNLFFSSFLFCVLQKQLRLILNRVSIKTYQNLPQYCVTRYHFLFIGWLKGAFDFFFLEVGGGGGGRGGGEEGSFHSSDLLEKSLNISAGQTS